LTIQGREVERQTDQEIVAALERRRGFTTHAINSTLKAVEMLGLAIAGAAAQARASREPMAPLYGAFIEANARASRSDMIAKFLQARMRRVPARHRPHYVPTERYQVLMQMRFHGMTIQEAADELLVSQQTIARWIDEATREPDKESIGTLLRAKPPLMRYSDGERDLVAAMSRVGFGGNLKIAQTLARAGVKISKETVRRYRKKPRKPGGPAPEVTKLVGRILRAKRPGHIWMLDLTEIRGLFGLFKFKLAVVIDVFSRMPMLGQVFTTDPDGEQMAKLVEIAAAKHGPPSHFVNDHGPQFTSTKFKAKLATLGVKQRFGAVGKSGSIAIIERFWRTVKDNFKLKLRPPLTVDELQSRLMIGLHYYAYYRPHQGLGGATPAEVY
jgi:putative transposase